jgi:hypothetical protein
MSAGMSGFLGLNPWSSDPMQSLTAISQQQPQDQPQAAPAPAPAPAPDPATTGAVPAAAPAAAPASSGGGGLGGFLGGLFGGGGARPGDDAVDPNTGATVGQVRQANLQSIQKLGLILLASSGRMSGDQRAAILSRAGDALDNSGQLNEFAKMRLQMANARLAERKQQQSEQKSAYVRALLGGSGAATLGVPGAAGGGASAGGGGATGVGSTPLMPDASGAMPAPAAAPTAAPAAAAGAGAAPTSGVTAGMSPGEVAAVGGMDDEKALEYLAKRRGELDGAARTGPVYTDPDTGEKRMDTFANGQKTGSISVGKLLGQVTDETGPDGSTRRVTRTGDKVTGIADVQEAPEVRENRQALMSATRADRDTLHKDYQENIQKSVQTYDKLQKVRTDVLDGKGYFGAVEGNGYVRGALNALADINPRFKSYAGDLNVTSNFERVMKEGVAGVIKNFNGSNGVSNADRDFAVQVMQAASTGNREAVRNALENAMADQRGIIGRYNENASRHNSNLSDYSGSLKNRFIAPTVDRDFDKEENEFQSRRQQQATAATAAVPARASTPQDNAAAQAARTRAQQFTDEQRAAAAAELARRRGQGAR